MPVWRTVVRTSYPGTGGPAYSTFHWRDSGADPVDGALEALEALSLAYQAIAPSQIPAVSHSTDGRFVEVDGDRLLDLDGWTVAGQDATANLEQLPPANQICVTWRTASNSRSGRGRTFLAGWNESNNVNGVPGNTLLGRVATFRDRIVSFNGGIDNGAFVVWSETQQIARDISSSSVTAQWAVMRSRRD